MPNLEAITTPWTWGTALVASFAGYLGAFQPVWELLVATSTWWFGGLTVFSGFIAPELGQPWESAAETAVLVGAVVFISIAAVKIGRSLRGRFL